MMYSMITHYPINLGHVIAELIASPGQNSKPSTIFARSYITYLVRGMDALNRVQSMERVGGIITLGLSTLCAIGIVERRGQEFTLARHPKCTEEEKHEEKPHTPMTTPPGRES